MLESLSGMNRAEVQGVLSSITMSLLPNPNPELRASIDDGLYKRVLAEARERLDVSSTEETADTRSLIVDFLGNQISESVLRGVNVDHIKARLGESGYLRPDEYQVKISPDYESLIDILRLDESEVLETVIRPDRVEHLPQVQLKDGSTEGVSFSLKLFGNGHNRYALITISFRKGHAMEVQSALRAFLSDVDIHPSQSPLEAFRALVDRYGARFQLGNLPGAKLYRQELLPLAPGFNRISHPVFSKYLRLLEQGSDYFSCFIARPIPSLQLVIFSLVFVLDLGKVRKDTEAHGIRIASEDEIQARHSLSMVDTKSLLGGKTTGQQSRRFDK